MKNYKKILIMALGTYLLLGTGCTNKDNEDNKDIKNKTRSDD